MGIEFKNTIAKILIIAWIFALIYFSIFVAKASVVFDPNAYFGLPENGKLPVEAVKEIKVLFLMLSVSIIGGVSFIIKDFYKSVKFANIYDRAYEDYKVGNITHEGFQRLATVEIYSGRFNHTWTYWFLIQPVLSIVLGIIAFFIARSGLGIIQSSSVDPDLTIKSLYMYAVFTFLAGFSSHKFIAWLDRLADKIFSSTLPEEKAAKKMGVESAAIGDRQNLKEELIDLGVAYSVRKDLEIVANVVEGSVVSDVPKVESLENSPSKSESPKKESAAAKPMKSVR